MTLSSVAENCRSTRYSAQNRILQSHRHNFELFRQFGNDLVIHDRLRLLALRRSEIVDQLCYSLIGDGDDGACRAQAVIGQSIP